MKFNFPTYIPYFFFSNFPFTKKERALTRIFFFTSHDHHVPSRSPFTLEISRWILDGWKTRCQIQGNTLLAVARIANAPLTFYTRAEYFPTGPRRFHPRFYLLVTIEPRGGRRNTNSRVRARILLDSDRVHAISISSGFCTGEKIVAGPIERENSQDFGR